ncbi:MAG TPA: SCO family protein [Longimicrobiales bacterium]
MSERIDQNPVSDTGNCKGALKVTARRAVLTIAAALALAACTPGASSLPAGPAGGPGGPFHLTDQDGRPVDQHVLDGKWSIVFFGYTYCPDFCPTTLTTLGSALDELGPKANDLQVVFITVDPARDSPGQLKTYLSSKVFPRHTIGLTGTPAQIAEAAKDYVVYYQKDGTGPNYTMDHSTALYLMDPHGRFRAVIADGLTPDQEAHAITQAMAGQA